MSFRLRVTWDEGRFVTLRVDRAWPIRQVKKAIEKMTGLPAHEQRLFHGARRELFDDDTVADLPPGYAADLLLARYESESMEWMTRVEQSWEELAAAPAAVREDLEVVHRAIANDGRALQYAAPSLQADHELVALAVQRTPEAFEFADAELQADWDIVGMAIGGNCDMLKFAGSEQRADRDTVLWVVEHSGLMLQFAASALRGDRPLVLRALQQNGLALQFADESLRADRDVVLAAVTQCGNALKFASEELRADKELVLAAVRDSATAMRFAAGPLTNDTEVNRAAMLQDQQAVAIKDKGKTGASYAWMGLTQEKEQDAGYAAAPMAALQDALEDEELCAEDRLLLATHWRMQEPCGLVHRWAPVTMVLPRCCAECVVGRHIWCGLCGPVTMPEAQSAMNRVSRSDPQRARNERVKVEKFLGAGLHFSNQDLRISSFKGVH